MPGKILVVDDEADIRRLICEILSDEGYDAGEAGGSDEALAHIGETPPDLMILDIWLEGSSLDGIQLLQAARENLPDLPVIMISGHADIETAVNAIKLGAYDFVEKPFKADRLLVMIERALDAAALRRENAELRQRTTVVPELVGDSSAIADMRAAIERVAQTDSRILISGPPGVGKEVIARLMHQKSKRSDSPFVVLNCATMAPERMEEELFGIEDSVSGAISSKGTFEQADGGTLLLDEVSDMPPATQGKIVRVLQEQTFHRVGGSDPVKVDVRVIATTNRDLQSLITDGKFREDLFYRLNVVPLAMRPLKDRPADIPPLMEYFMQRASGETGIPAREIAPDAMALLQSYDWPGNARQMRNVVEWLLIMAGGGAGEPVRAEMLPPEIAAAAPQSMGWDEGAEIMGLPLRDAREMFERQYLKAQIARFGGNVSKTAGFVGMERSALHRKLKMLGLSANDRIEGGNNA